jgi:tyrosyl-tRNA synthetase
MSVSTDEQIRILARRSERIVPEEDLRKKLARSAQNGKPLRIKFGMDPTAPDVTLGHAVPMKIIRQFQDWGHKAVLIIGDYTARVGDPSGRNTTRPVLSGEQIDANAKTYVAQVGKILRTDPEHLEVRYNGEWLGRMNLVEIIKLAARKSVAQVLAREDFAKRFKEGVDIRLHEIMYPLLQGWDSVMIEADVEMGGSDQLFNNLVGRDFQKDERPDDPLAGQVVIVTPLLVGTDGQIKMSKSKGNYIGITDAPSGQDGMFGKIMSLPDHVMETYYTLLTDLPAEEYRPLIASKPRDAKVALAKEIISWLHPDPTLHAASKLITGVGDLVASDGRVDGAGRLSKAADTAEAEFLKVIVQGEIPDEMPVHRLQFSATEVFRVANLLAQTGLVPSASEGRRKIAQGAVSIDGKRVTDPRTMFVFDDAFTAQVPLRNDAPVIRKTSSCVLQLGNRRFVRLVSTP